MPPYFVEGEHPATQAANPPAETPTQAPAATDIICTKNDRRDSDRCAMTASFLGVGRGYHEPLLVAWLRPGRYPWGVGRVKPLRAQLDSKIDAFADELVALFLSERRALVRSLHRPRARRCRSVVVPRASLLAANTNASVFLDRIVGPMCDARLGPSALPFALVLVSLGLLIDSSPVWRRELGHGAQADAIARRARTRPLPRLPRGGTNNGLRIPTRPDRVL